MPTTHQRTLAALLATRKPDLILSWTTRVLEDPGVPVANRLRAPVLVDHIPNLIDHLIVLLDDATAPNGEVGATDDELADVRDSAKHHARLRFDNGYSLKAVLRELSHLRVALVVLCQEAGSACDPAELLRVHTAIDEVMWTSAGEMERASRVANEEHEEHFRLAAAASGFGAWRYHAATGAVRWDERTKALLGVTPGSEDTYDTFLACVHPDDREATHAAVQRALDPAGDGTYWAEYRVSGAPGGQERWIEARGRAWFDGEGMPPRFLGTLIDVTDRKRAEAARLEELAYRDLFIGILSHDLRNPVTAITFAASALRHQDELSQAQAKTLGRITSSTARIAHMIDDLLDLSRSRIGVMPVELEPADLHSICQQAIGELAGVSSTTPVVLETEGDGGGAWDPHRLAQLVSNLVSNAIDYSAPDTPVRVAVTAHGEDVLLSVTNQGPVIPPVALASLFEPFLQGPRDGLKSRRGLGLGLFIARQIAEAHGGHIAAASSATEGTTFSVRLPRVGAPRKIERPPPR